MDIKKAILQSIFMKITNHDGCGKIMLGDSADETNEILNCIQRQDIYAIPPKSNTRNPWRCDWTLYKERHLVECFFLKLKQFRRVASRYDSYLYLSGCYFCFVETDQLHKSLLNKKTPV